MDTIVRDNVEPRSPVLDRPKPAAGPGQPGRARRFWDALCRGILGRSSWDYLKQYTGNDAYWDNAIAAELGWPAKDSQGGSST